MTKYEDRLIEEMIATYEIGMGYIWILDGDTQTLRLVVEKE